MKTLLLLMVLLPVLTVTAFADVLMAPMILAISFPFLLVIGVVVITAIIIRNRKK